MTPKFRIYDSEAGYYVTSTRFLLSMEGQLLDTYDTTWHNTGERYEIEMLVATDPYDRFIFEGDIVSGAYGYGYPNPEVVRVREFMYAVTECLVDENLKIIGTIHDEKYKNL